MKKLLNDLDKKIEEANSGMRVASPSVVISLNMAMNIRSALVKTTEKDESEEQTNEPIQIQRI